MKAIKHLQQALTTSTQSIMKVQHQFATQWVHACHGKDKWGILQMLQTTLNWLTLNPQVNGSKIFAQMNESLNRWTDWYIDGGDLVTLNNNTCPPAPRKRL